MDEVFSPKEQQLLRELDALGELAEKLSQKLFNTQQSLELALKEIETTQRTMNEIREENQHLREVMQTWRKRLSNTLNSLDPID